MLTRKRGCALEWTEALRGHARVHLDQPAVSRQTDPGDGMYVSKARAPKPWVWRDDANLLFQCKLRQQRINTLSVAEREVAVLERLGKRADAAVVVGKCSGYAKQASTEQQCDWHEELLDVMMLEKIVFGFL